MSKFKYDTQLEMLKAEGYEMPEVSTPNDKSACRFVFANKPEKNHLPVCVSNPKRVLPGPVKTSGYALSCFADEAKARNRYHALQNSFKRISTAIGDSLANGVIRNNDGLITLVESTSSHFDLYEYKECDLNKTFKLNDIAL